MSDLLKAADEIGKLTKMFSALESVKPFLTKLGSLEQACDEAKSALSSAVAEHAKLKGEIADAKLLLGNAKKAASAEMSALAAECDKARSEALAIVASGEADAKALRDSAAGFLAAEQAKEKNELASLQAKAKAAEVALADVERRTAVARETLGNLAKLAGV